MGVEPGTALLLGSAISGVTAVAGGIISSSVTSAAANAQAKLEREAANREANALEEDAKRKRLDLKRQKESKIRSRRELRRKNKIIQSRRIAAAAGSGLAVSGTSMEQLLNQSQMRLEEKEQNFGFEWDSKLVRQHDAANLVMYQAENRRDMGAMQSAATLQSGYAKASGQMWGGVIDGASKIGSGFISFSAREDDDNSDDLKGIWGE